MPIEAILIEAPTSRLFASDFNHPNSRNQLTYLDIRECHQMAPNCPVAYATQLRTEQLQTITSNLNA